MDLRMVKTQSAICESFYALRRKMPLEKIQVNELCKAAQINKSTFYRHYPDVYALSDALEAELVNKVTSGFVSSNMLFSDPEWFITGLMEALAPYEQEILILFNERIHVFSDRLEDWLAEIYLTDTSTEAEKITLSFLAGGAIHAFLSPRFRKEDTMQTVIGLLDRLNGT